MKNIISNLFQLVRNNDIEIYNKFRLQHELGIFLRYQYPELKIQFERNVSYFGLDKNKYEKKEIYLTMFSNQQNLES